MKWLPRGERDYIEPGWYWFELEPEAEWHIVEVRYHRDDEFYVHFGDGTMKWLHDDLFESSRFSGPIPTPEEE